MSTTTGATFPALIQGAIREPAEWAACRKRTAEEARGVIEASVLRRTHEEWDTAIEQQKYAAAVLNDK